MMYRNRKLLDAVRDLPCQHCGAPPPSEPAHSNQLRDGKGRGIKSHDYRVAALCHADHAELDQGAHMSRDERIEMFEEAHRKTIGLLFERGVVREWLVNYGCST